jgi:hypothetical protein
VISLFRDFAFLKIQQSVLLLNWQFGVRKKSISIVTLQNLVISTLQYYWIATLKMKPSLILHKRFLFGCSSVVAFRIFFLSWYLRLYKVMSKWQYFYSVLLWLLVLFFLWWIFMSYFNSQIFFLFKCPPSSCSWYFCYIWYYLNWSSNTCFLLLTFCPIFW